MQHSIHANIHSGCKGVPTGEPSSNGALPAIPGKPPICTCSLAPELLQGVEASLYAGLMSVSNAGQNASSALIALVSHLVGVTSSSFGNMWVLILAAQVPPVSLLWGTMTSCQHASAALFAAYTALVWE